MSNNPVISILGAGSWGTAVAITLARAGYSTFLWSHKASQVQDMASSRCNQRYIPDVTFPENLTPCDDLHACVAQANYVIVAVPSHAFSTLLQRLPKPQNGLAWLTKGLEPIHNRLFSELVSDLWGKDYPVAAISGPSFAQEVAQGLPTALVIASHFPLLQRELCQILHHQPIRAYLSDDLEGVQLCGGIKNILAIACGISDGLGFGSNSNAALITRGLAEMQRLLLACHAKSETCLGLAGVGDLVLTCTDNQSRNRRFGLLLGQGHSSSAAEQLIGQIIEGKHNSAQICALAKRHQVEMPICYMVQQVLTEQLTPQQAVHSLLDRPPREE